MFERLASSQKFEASKETIYRLAASHCTVLIFSCNILWFQKQVCAFNKMFLGPTRVLSHVWLKGTMRILKKFAVGCWRLSWRYSPFSQAHRAPESLKEKICLVDPVLNTVSCC